MFPQQTSSFVIFCPYFWFWHIERSVFPRQFRFHSQTYLLTNLNNHVKSHHYLFACLKDSCQFAAKVLPGHLDQLENQKKITWCHYFQDCNSIKASDQFAKWTPLKTTTTTTKKNNHKTQSWSTYLDKAELTKPPNSAFRMITACLVPSYLVLEQRLHLYNHPTVTTVLQPWNPPLRKYIF